MIFALHHFDKHFLRACVRLTDINGSHGEVDKRCQKKLKLAGQNSMVIDDAEADLYFAIDRACERCMRTVARRLESSRQHLDEMLSLQKNFNG